MIGHQTVVEVDGVAILTLADLWPSRCEAVIVGVNPAPASVAVGHYYQGANGRLAMSRLRSAGLLPTSGGGYADDDALAVGVGFTDIVKRPTTSARGLTRRELDAGRGQLRHQLARHLSPLVVCVFKPAVTALLDEAGPPGFQTRTFAGARVFRMPGPYAPSPEVATVMAELAAHLQRDR